MGRGKADSECKALSTEDGTVNSQDVEAVILLTLLLCFVPLLLLISIPERGNVFKAQR